MSFGSDTPGGSPEGIGGNESGIGGSDSGGRGDSHPSYSPEAMAAALAQSTIQARSNNVERGLMSMPGMSLDDVAESMNTFTGLDQMGRMEAPQRMEEINRFNDFRSQGPFERAKSNEAARTVGMAPLSQWDATTANMVEQGTNALGGTVGGTFGTGVGTMLGGPVGGLVGGYLGDKFGGNLGTNAIADDDARKVKEALGVQGLVERVAGPKAVDKLSEGPGNGNSLAWQLLQRLQGGQTG